MLGWRSGQCKIKMAVLCQFTYYWTESHMIRWKAAMKIHFHSHSSIPIPTLLFPLPYPFSRYIHCQSHSRGNPMEQTGSQLFPFPCTSLVRAMRIALRGKSTEHSTSARCFLIEDEVLMTKDTVNKIIDVSLTLSISVVVRAVKVESRIKHRRTWVNDTIRYDTIR